MIEQRIKKIARERVKDYNRFKDLPIYNLFIRRREWCILLSKKEKIDNYDIEMLIQLEDRIKRFFNLK